MNQELLRRLPSVEKLLHALGETEGLPRALAAHLVREYVARLRAGAAEGQAPPEFPAAVEQVQEELAAFARSRLRPVINATGVMIHTNLGRSPLPERAAEAVRDIACGYTNLEFDLDTGERGKRARFLETALAALTGAEAATVVNNCAAALVLALRHLTAGERKEVIISRGELVEIGGGFRIPDIMETSGAVLREIGTTNRTRADDYRAAITPRTGMLLQVHRSNFYIEGFTETPDLADLATIAREHGIPLVCDLGSGAMVDTQQCGLAEHEPTPQEMLRRGADLVCFSGDKLLGGPQAGILCGRADIIAGLKRDPFYRVLRCDKLAAAALQEAALACLEHASAPEGTPLPLLLMMSAPLETLRARAERLMSISAEVSKSFTLAIGTGTSRCGGGTMPKSSLPSITLDLRPLRGSVEALAARLRLGSAPVVGYIEGNTLKLDLRTVLPPQDEVLASALATAAENC